MLELIDPGIPSEHPRARYFYNLEHGQSVTWYSSTLSVLDAWAFNNGLAEQGYGL